MSRNEPRTEDLEIKGGENDRQMNIKIDEKTVNVNYPENKTEKNETKTNSKIVNRMKGAARDESTSILEEEEKMHENDAVDENREKTTNLELRKKENKLILQGKSQMSIIELEDKETQTEPAMEEKDDGSSTMMDTLMQEFLEQIKCPVCYEYMVPPIIQCNNGHNICKTCKPQMSHCPTCRGGFSNVKNISAETLSKSITHPCKFKNSGCTGQFLVNLDPDFKGIHEGICRNAPHKCPYSIVNTCTWEGPMPDMKQHIQNTHECTVYVEQGKQTKCNINYIKYISQATYFWHGIVFTHDHVFFSYRKIVNNLLHMCFMFVGSREDTNNYKYRVSIKSCDGNKSVTSCFECPHYLDCTDGKFPNDKCAAFPVEFTKLCANSDGGLPYEYEIFQ